MAYEGAKNHVRTKSARSKRQQYPHDLILQWTCEDDWMMQVLHTAATLQLPDWCVSAGFVRSKVWDMLHGYTARTPLADVDVAYHNPADLNEQTEKEYEAKLRQLLPGVPWSVKNQARMHIAKGEAQYTSTADALAKYPETCTAVGLRLDANGAVSLIAPLGVTDLMDLRVLPTPHFIRHAEEKAAIYNGRVRQKNWIRKWPRLRIVELAPGGTASPDIRSTPLGGGPE